MKEWVLDVSFTPPCFCPYDRETDEVVIGMAVIAARAPGKLVGVIHHGGPAAVEAWCLEHSDWPEEYGPAQPGGET